MRASCSLAASCVGVMRSSVYRKHIAREHTQQRKRLSYSIYFSDSHVGRCINLQPSARTEGGMLVTVRSSVVAPDG